MANALQWPAGGSIDDAEPVLRPDGAAPRGCRCFNDAENQILEDEVPECRLEELFDEIDLATREECQSLVLPGYDHNCWTTNGPQASTVENKFPNGSGSCIGNCEYGGPPAGGSCPVLNPYECATGEGDGGCALNEETEDTTDGDGLDGSGSEGGILPSEDTITCNGNECEITEWFARTVYEDPSFFIKQGTRLLYDATSKRHSFVGVKPGSLAYDLGIRTSDRLESINGIIIRDLDSALKAYATLNEARTLNVRIQRASQWIDFVITIVH